MDIVDQIMESYNKNKAHLMETVGMETDEDAGVNINEMTAP